MSSKVKKGKEESLAHHGLIKLLVCDVIERKVVIIPWKEFVTIDR
jgi:hypothetical protein